MSWPDNYGRLWGQIPNTAGQVYWVAPAASYTVNGQSFSASDNNHGLSPEQALLTVDRAWNLVTANVGDVIVLLPGTHAPSASIAADVAGVTMMGLPGGRGNFMKPKAKIDNVTGDECINVTAADIEIAHIEFEPTTALTALDLSADADNLYIHDCSFDMATPVANTGTIGIEALGAASNVLIEHCYFECDGAQGNAIVATALLDSLIDNCLLLCSAGTWASAILCGAGTDRLVIRRTEVHCSGTAITIGVNGTGADQASGVFVTDCRFGSLVAVPVDAFDAGECEIAEVYHLGVGATDGGEIITAIT